MAPTALPALLLLLLAATASGQTFNTSLVTSGLVGNPFTTFAIITFPPCKYSGQTASVNIVSAGSPTRTETFTVPPCRMRRNAVFITDNSDSNTIVRNVGYEIDNLTPNTNYTVTYTIAAKDKSQSYTFSTVKYINYMNVPNTMARSGGMVVITVLLSIAMGILVACLIATLVIGGRN